MKKLCTIQARVPTYNIVLDGIVPQGNFQVRYWSTGDLLTQKRVIYLNGGSGESLIECNYVLFTIK